jgi:hypothetical protein
MVRNELVQMIMEGKQFTPYQPQLQLKKTPITIIMKEVITKNLYYSNVEMPCLELRYK